jgi:hypothetical protein
MISGWLWTPLQNQSGENRNIIMKATSDNNKGYCHNCYFISLVNEEIAPSAAKK